MPFGKFVMKHEAFTSGKFNTHFVQNYFKPEMLDELERDDAEIASIAAAHILNVRKGESDPYHVGDHAVSYWKNKRT